ncbi:MAG: helix-turn-helix domain-containing protein [Olsenella profusa]
MPDFVYTTFMGGHFIDLVPYEYGHESCSANHSFGPARRNHFLFHYVINGTGRLDFTRSDGQEGSMPIHAGQGFIIFPRVVTTYQADGDNPWQYLWIEFDGLRMAERLSQAGFSQDYPLYQPTSQYERDMMMQEMLYIVAHGRESTLGVVGHAYLFLEHLIRSSFKPREDTNGGMSEFYVREALEFVGAHYQEDITVEDIAANSGLDRSYFGSLFKRSVGTTPQRFLMGYRMDRACELLECTSLPIAAIGRAVGYSKQLHFSRAFKNARGVSPRQWRRQTGTTEGTG